MDWIHLTALAFFICSGIFLILILLEEEFKRQNQIRIYRKAYGWLAGVTVIVAVFMGVIALTIQHKDIPQTALKDKPAVHTAR